MRSALLAAIFVASCATEPTVPAGVVPDAGAVGDVGSSETLAAPKTGAIRVAALNVRRMFDSSCDSGMCGKDDFEAVSSEAQIAARVEQIASRLRYLNADVIMLEEVETAALLDAIAAKMPGYPTHFLGEIGFTASLDVGVLSRFPMLETKSHRDQPLTRPDGTSTSFTRELLEVHLDRGGGARVVAFAAHFRSKNGDDPGRRYAEAVAARDIVAQAAADHPSALVVLGGDLNDVPGSPPIAAMEEKLARVSAGLPNDVIATYWFGGEGQPIDHLFVPSPTRIVAGTFAVARDPGERSFAGSDHAAVYAELE